MRSKKPAKPQGPRFPHAATAVAGRGTPSVPPEEAVGAYATDSIDRSTATQEPQAQRATMTGYAADRSRSRESPRESTPVVPVAQPVVMNVPDYLLPIMATAGVGHLSLDQDRTQNMGDIPPPKAAQPSTTSIHDFFESFNQAQDREGQVRAIQQFTAELLNAPQESASPASRETPDPKRPPSTGVTGGRMSSSHASPDTAAAASRESSTPQEESREDARSSPADRGRQPSMRERVASGLYWPSLKSLIGSGRRPKSPPLPPRPKPEPAPKRANSMPRLSDSTSTESASGTTPSAPVNPITIVPAVQIPAPVAVETTTATPAPEVASDAETLALPGLPETTGDENVPSPVEEEVERTMDDPYVSAVEGVASGESAPTETAPEAAPTEHARGEKSSSSKGFDGLVQVIPIPTVPEAPGTTTESVAKPTETVSKEAREAVPSESSSSAAKPPSGDAVASKSPSGEAEASKLSTREAEASNPPSGETASIRRR